MVSVKIKEKLFGRRTKELYFFYLSFRDLLQEFLSERVRIHLVVACLDPFLEGGRELLSYVRACSHSFHCGLIVLHLVTLLNDFRSNGATESLGTADRC